MAAMGSDDQAVAGRFDWERAIRGSELPAMTRLVGLTLATFGNRDGSNCRPGVERLALACGLSARRCRDHLVGLHDAGYVIKTGEAVPRKATAAYQLSIPGPNYRTVRPLVAVAEETNYRTETTQLGDGDDTNYRTVRPPTKKNDQDKHHSDDSHRPQDPKIAATTKALGYVVDDLFNRSGFGFRTGLTPAPDDDVIDVESWEDAAASIDPAPLRRKADAP